MIFVFRLIIGVILGILICIFGVIFCLFNPRNPKNVAKFAHIFSLVFRPLFGVKVITRAHKDIKNMGRSVFIANQSMPRS